MLVETELDTDVLLDRAISFCTEKLGQDQLQVRQHLSNGSRKAHSTLRYAIAKRTAEYLGQLDCGIRGVYLYGSAMSDDAGLCSDIDLIVLVERKLDQARTLLQRVDLALLASYRALIGSQYLPPTLLDVHLVDVKEEQKCRGYGVVIRSLQTCPVSLWEYSPA